MASRLKTEQQQVSVDLAEVLAELTNKIDRLKTLYEQYFMGIEKMEPQVARKEVARALLQLQQSYIRNTALRFKFNTMLQKWNLYVTYWNRVLREIENGTYTRHLARAKRAEQARAGTPAPSRPNFLDADTDLHAKVSEEREAPGGEEDLDQIWDRIAPSETKRGVPAAPGPASSEAKRPVAPAPVLAPSRGAAERAASPAFVPSTSPPERAASPAFVPSTSPPERAAPPAFAPSTSPPTRAAPPLSPPGGSDPTRDTPPLSPPSMGQSKHVTPPASPLGMGDAKRAARPVSPPGMSDAKRPAAPPIPGMSETELRDLHRRFLAAQRGAGESRELKYELLVQSLVKQLPTLMARPGVKGVRFDVALKDGKPILRAIPQK